MITLPPTSKEANKIITALLHKGLGEEMNICLQFKRKHQC